MSLTSSSHKTRNIVTFFGLTGTAALVTKFLLSSRVSKQDESEIAQYQSDSVYPSPSSATKSSVWTEIQVKAHPFMPLRFTSSFWGYVTSYSMPVCLRNIVYGSFCRAYNCDMGEAEESDYRSYRNMSELFRRKLKDDYRPISKDFGVVSPSDGRVLHFGPVKNELQDVKGLDYSIKEFLGLKSDDFEKELLVDKSNKTCLYECIIYLAPGDYHRFHSPTEWEVSKRRHFPGFLLSVKPVMVNRMPKVLNINERVCYLGKWNHGFFSMTAVGATNVGSIKVNFDKDLKTNRRHLFRANMYPCYEHEFKDNVKLLAGDEFGEFNFGSTIVLIFEAPKNTSFQLSPNQKVKYGQLIAKANGKK